MSRCGTRTGYVTGCRCEPCRQAHREYNLHWDRHQRRVQYGLEERHTPYVDASEAIAHIHWLRSQGIGKRTIAKASGIGVTSITEFSNGTRTRARQETIDRILAVGTHRIKPGIRIDAAPTWELINDLLAFGFTKARIAKELGNKTPALQINRHRVNKSTADNMRQVWQRLVQETEPWHGTYTGYARHKCRCIRCRQAMRDYTNERRAAS